MLKYGIEPQVTIVHFDLPLHLATEYDGWYNRKTIDFYMNYVETIFNRYKNKVKYWLTFNEINFCKDYTNLGITEALSRPDKVAQAVHHMLVAAAKTVIRGHEINPEFQIGMMINYSEIYPEDCGNVLLKKDYVHSIQMFKIKDSIQNGNLLNIKMLVLN